MNALQQRTQLNKLLFANGIKGVKVTGIKVTKPRTLAQDYKAFKNGNVHRINSMQSSILLYIHDLKCSFLEVEACQVLNTAYMQLATPIIQVSTHQGRKE
jgi:hypothetical protein